MSELTRRKELCVNVRNLSEENPDNEYCQFAYELAQRDVAEIEYYAKLRKVT